jgi:nucleotide-binding universal stress UspA family protein
MPFERILVAVDFSDVSDRALEHALELAASLGAKVTVVHAYQIPIYDFPDGTIVPSAEHASAIAEAAQRHMDAMIARHKDRGVPLDAVLRQGAPADEILAVAKERGHDLIVIGTHSRGPFGRAFYGDVAMHVQRAATLPVLTFH